MLVITILIRVFFSYQHMLLPSFIMPDGTRLQQRWVGLGFGCQCVSGFSHCLHYLDSTSLLRPWPVLFSCTKHEAVGGWGWATARPLCSCSEGLQLRGGLCKMVPGTASLPKTLQDAFVFIEVHCANLAVLLYDKMQFRTVQIYSSQTAADWTFFSKSRVSVAWEQKGFVSFLRSKPFCEISVV